MNVSSPLLLVASTGAAAVDTLHSGDCHSRSASPSPSQHTVVSIVPCVTFYILMLPSNPGPEEWTVDTADTVDSRRHDSGGGTGGAVSSMQQTRRDLCSG